MTDMWPSAPSQGFLNCPFIKYLGGGSVSGKAVHDWQNFSKKSVSQNDLPDLDSLVQIKNRDTKSSPTCSEGPTRARLQFLATLLGKLERLTRTRDIPF